YLGGLLLNVAWAAAAVAALIHFGQDRTPGNDPVLGAVVIGGFVLFSWAKLALAAKRLHDLGKSGWVCLLLFIPLLGFIAVVFLLRASGDLFDNQYGPARQKDQPWAQPTRP